MITFKMQKEKWTITFYSDKVEDETLQLPSSILAT